MKRIGIAASKMAKDHLALYNFYVVLLSFLFSFFIFVVAGAAVVLALAVIGYVAEQVPSLGLSQGGSLIFTVCMVSLTVVVAVFNLCAVSVNLKFPKKEGARDE